MTRQRSGRIKYIARLSLDGKATPRQEAELEQLRDERRAEKAEAREIEVREKAVARDKKTGAYLGANPNCKTCGGAGGLGRLTARSAYRYCRCTRSKAAERRRAQYREIA